MTEHRESMHLAASHTTRPVGPATDAAAALRKRRPRRTPVRSRGTRAVAATAAGLLAVGAISVFARGDHHRSAVTPGSIADTTLVTGGVEDFGTTPASDGLTDSGLAGTAIVTPIVTTSATGLPSVDAKAYAVYDVTANRWLAASNADSPMPVGSVMKLLTSYVVLQAGDLGKIVTVPALTEDVDESMIGLYEGEQLPRDVLLRAMLIVSANDAARTLATDVGGSIDEFVNRMNSAAQVLGMTNTVAANPIGLDALGAHSSAHDMISLATLLMQNATFRKAVIKPSANLHGQTFNSTNGLLQSYDGATGVKTGHTTDAGYTRVIIRCPNGPG